MCNLNPSLSLSLSIYIYIYTFPGAMIPVTIIQKVQIVENNFNIRPDNFIMKLRPKLGIKPIFLII